LRLKIKFIFILVFCLNSLAGSIYNTYFDLLAQDQVPEEKKEDLSEKNGDNKNEVEENFIVPEDQIQRTEYLDFTYNFLLDLESFFKMGENQTLEETNLKNEIRYQTKIIYGSEDKYFFSRLNVYLRPMLFNEDLSQDYYYSEDTELARNLRLSSHTSEIIFNELYFNYSRDNFRIRAGNQIYAWGTADRFNPTSYFNPLDLRELFFKDEDEFRLGTLSLSSTFFLKDYSLDFVFVPVHSPSLLAPNNNFWSFSMNHYFFPVKFKADKGEELDEKNFAYGTKISGNRHGVDFSLSAYHGPDNNPLWLPMAIQLQANEPLSILVDPKYYVLNMLGGDFSVNINRFVFQGELSFSPDKKGLAEYDFNNTNKDLTLPLAVKESFYFSYAFGFNYSLPLHLLIHNYQGNPLFSFEWFQAKYLDKDLASPFITDLVTLKFEDSYFDDYLYFSLTGLYGFKNKDRIITPLLSYDFQNGFKVEFSYSRIKGKDSGSSRGLDSDNSVFYYLKDDDILRGNFSYEY